MTPCPVCAAPVGPAKLRGRDRLLGVPGEFSVRECPDCGLAVTEPRLEGEALARYYPDEYAPHRPPSGALGRLLAANRRWKADSKLRVRPYRLLAELDATPDAPRRPKVLDVGCGRGDLAAAFARRGWRACGVDPSAGAAEAARALGVDARVGTLDDVRCEPATFDAVVFNHSLEHVPDPVGALRRAGELLRPGGRVAVAVPNWGSGQRRVFRARWFQLDLPRHLQHFDRRSLREATNRAGLTALESGTSVSVTGLPGSLEYATVGRWIGRGRRLRPALAVVTALYPLTAVAGRLAGGDSLWLVAERPGR